MRRLIILGALLCGSASAFAVTGRIIKLQGYLVTRGKAKATIKDDKGVMNVPLDSIDFEHTKIGDWTVVSVDFVDFFRMNPDKFKTSTAK